MWKIWNCTPLNTTLLFYYIEIILILLITVSRALPEISFAPAELARRVRNHPHHRSDDSAGIREHGSSNNRALYNMRIKYPFLTKFNLFIVNGINYLNCKNSKNYRAKFNFSPSGPDNYCWFGRLDSVSRVSLCKTFTPYCFKTGLVLHN